MNFSHLAATSLAVLLLAALPSAALAVDNDSDTFDSAADCNDNDGSIYPGASEFVADGIDQDCDGGDLCYRDGDDDGWRPAFFFTRLSDDLDCDDAFEAGNGTPTGDCDDDDPARSPGFTEVCDVANVDEDCDGLADDGDDAPSGRTTWYADADGDGYGDVSLPMLRCDGGAGLTSNFGDCDDSDAEIYPAAVEQPGDGIDQDCDGAENCFVDSDEDGFRTTATVVSMLLACNGSGEAPASYPAGDCDDGDSGVFPGTMEIVGDGTDQDCNGMEICYTDPDGDGFRSDVWITFSSDDDCDDTGEVTNLEPTGDCDNLDASIQPGAVETIADGVDQDCDAAELCYADNDDDGLRATTTVLSLDLDCDDAFEGVPEDEIDPNDGNVDNTPPETLITMLDPSYGSDTTPSFTLSSNEPAVFECSIDMSAFVPCVADYTVAVTEGPHTITVRATDLAGNVDPTPESIQFVVDTSPPDTFILEGPDNNSTQDSGTQIFEFTSNEIASMQCSVDDGAFLPCVSPHVAMFEDGEHIFRVRAEDAAGNLDPTPATRSFFVLEVDDFTLAGSGMSLASSSDPEKSSMKITTKDVLITAGNGNGSFDDPTVTGATLRVVGSTFDNTYSLSNRAWHLLGSEGDNKGYKYRDSDKLLGPIASVLIKAGANGAPGQLKIQGEGADLGHSLASYPGPVSVVLTVGGQRFCAEFGGSVAYTPDLKFKAKKAPAPGGCPAP